MSWFKRKDDQKGRDEISHRSQVKSMIYVGQSFWYILTIVIYLGCTLLGFGVAYLITKVLVEMKVN